jgi:hypothetical protein
MRQDERCGRAEGGMTVTTETVGSAPAEGQLVTVRNRVWVVSDVARSTIAPQSMTGRPQHAVTLVSIEDDARDEQLRVVWELERGAVAHDQHVLPDPAKGFDDPRQLDAFLDAVRRPTPTPTLPNCGRFTSRSTRPSARPTPRTRTATRRSARSRPGSRPPRSRPGGRSTWPTASTTPRRAPASRSASRPAPTSSTSSWH